MPQAMARATVTEYPENSSHTWHASAVAGRTTALRVALCAVLCAVADATVESANAAGANASPPQTVTVANTAAAPMRCLLFCCTLTSPFVGAETPSSCLRVPLHARQLSGSFAGQSGDSVRVHVPLSDWIATAVIYRDSAIHGY
jgi:hypothetical protein